MTITIRQELRHAIFLTWRLATTIFFAERNISGAFRSLPLLMSPIVRPLITFFSFSVNERTTSPPGSYTAEAGFHFKNRWLKT